MSGIATTVGLISGINTGSLIDSLITLQRQGAARMESAVKTIQARQTSLQAAQASLITLSTAATQLKAKTTFQAFSVASSDESQMAVTAPNSASAGDYQLRTVQTARTHEIVSAGAANADTQTFGTGQIVLATGGGLDSNTPLSALNNGGGIRRGMFRITDRSGASATIDLSNAFSVNDVVNAINNASVSVTAHTEDGRMVLTDTTGSSAANLAVVDLSGGHAAMDLGIAGSVAGNSLTGGTIFSVAGNFSLDRLNDGNTMRLVTGDDLRITLTDDTQIDVDLDGVKTIDDVLLKINSASSNGGKLLASLSDGRLVLEDQSGGGGASAFEVQELNGSSVLKEIGLNRTASGTTISGGKLSGGLNSVLLHNLNGGKGITQTGEITVTDRAGRTATLDLTNAESLDEVIAAINGAKTVGDEKLGINARLDANGTGIEIVDTTGSVVSNLIIADVGGGTIAADLRIAVDSATTSKYSGNLALRYVNEATSLSTYAPGGSLVSTGAFKITDSTGASAVITVSATDKNLGDVMKRINEASGIQVTARLNDTGDGFVVIDDAGGATALKVEDLSGTPAKGLRLLGEGTLNGEGKSEISSRRATVVNVDADDTLNEIVKKINNSGEKVSASLINTGSPVNPLRLVIRSKTSGQAGRMYVDEGSLDLGFSTRVQGRDAVLQVGGDPESAYYLSSGTNTFNGAVGNLNVTVKAASQTAANVGVTQDGSMVASAVKSLVTNYNSWLSTYKTATKFDTATNTSGTLQGDTFALRIQDRLTQILNGRYGSTTSTIRTLQDLGVSINSDGTMTLDSTQLNAAMAANPQAVQDFFQTATTGFAEVLDKTIKGYTDPLTGSFKTRNDSLQSNVDSLADRISAIDAVLAIRKNRLVIQFSKMESTLASLQDSQASLAKIGSLSNNNK